MDKAKSRGVWICWDEEDVVVERRGAGTIHDRTVVTARNTITKWALWTNEVNETTIMAAESYIKLGHMQDYTNLRVEARERDLR